MQSEILSAVIGALGGLAGGFIGAALSFRAEMKRSKNEQARLGQEQAKLISSLISTDEVEKARIQAYTGLWRLLGAASTRHPDEIVPNLRKMQDGLQDWYYQRGGGLLVGGSTSKGGSTEAALFAARDLDSSDPSEIWQAFHQPRHCLRRDLRIFHNDEEEKKHIAETIGKIQSWSAANSSKALRI